MITLFLDAETYYDNDYSLRKMTPPQYILDPRFEMIGLAVIEGWPSNKPAYWIEGDAEVRKFFASLDPSVTSVVTHNALFDACLFAWRYGFVPRLIVDTMGISKALLGYILKRHSLASVSEYLGLPAKGDAGHRAKGLSLAAIKSQPDFYAEFVSYALRDAGNCRGIYDHFVPTGLFPIQELLVMDMVLRCAVVPKFRLDPNALAAHLAAVKAEKEILLAQSMLVSSADGVGDFMSNDRFAGVLRSLGVEPGTKVSKTTGKTTYAFAKTDQFMESLEEHENPAVQSVAAARLGHKSTLEETRTQRLLDISRVQWLNGDTALCPIPLVYGAAHTHRLGGGWRLNPQNLGRKSPIKRALIVRDDEVVIAADAAQIEARGVAAITEQMDLVEQFECNLDPYARFAEVVFNKSPVTKKDPERFIGKVNVLQLGFGSGWFTLQNAIRVQSKAQLGFAMNVSDEQAQHQVNTYRQRFPKIPAGWRALNYDGINVLAYGGSWAYGPCEFEKGAIRLPSGLRLYYHNLRRIDNEWWFDFAGKPEKLYGGKLMENIIQALARIITMYAGVRIQKRLRDLGYTLALQVHDELTYVVKRVHEDLVRSIISEEMRVRPSWLPTWPLDVEINSGPTYGDAK